jgi:hypothetical protein
MILLEEWFELEEKEQEEIIEKVKKFYFKRGLIVILDWLLFMEESQLLLNEFVRFSFFSQNKRKKRRNFGVQVMNYN